MSSYALLIALSGFSYSAVTRTLVLAPAEQAESFRCFFSTASGWGTLILSADRLEIRLAEGELRVDTLQVTWRGQSITFQPGVKLSAKKKLSIPFNTFVRK